MNRGTLDLNFCDLAQEFGHISRRGPAEQGRMDGASGIKVWRVRMKRFSPRFVCSARLKHATTSQFRVQDKDIQDGVQCGKTSYGFRSKAQWSRIAVQLYGGSGSEARFSSCTLSRSLFSNLPVQQLNTTLESIDSLRLISACQQIGFYKTFTRPIAKVLLMATFTYQLAYWGWQKLEKEESKRNKTGQLCSFYRMTDHGQWLILKDTAEIEVLEKQLGDLMKGKETKP